jgi:sulfite exporter TauE/SafE
LVYIAGAGASATGDLLSGVLYMAAFGSGTLPVMFGLGLLSPRLRIGAGARFQRLIPISVMLVATLLLLRGMALGIPYLSPDLGNGHTSCH